MTPDQVDDAGWSSEDWDALNDLAAQTVEKNARVRRVIPEGPSRPNAYMVELPKAEGFDFVVDTTRKVSRIRVDFKILAEQLHDLENIRAQVARVATALAQWEDRVLAYGAGAGKLTPPRGVTIVVDAEALGLFDGPEVDGKNAIGRVKAAIEKVLSAGRGGDLRAVFGFKTYTSLIHEEANDTNGIEHARALLGGTKEDMAWLPPDPTPLGNEKVAVFSPDPGSIDLVWTQRPRISHVGIEDGNLKLRLEEAFFLRIKDIDAIGVGK